MDSEAAVTTGSLIGGDFVIERDLARGGMGSVFVALQRSTGRKRALKIVHPSLLTSAHEVERFMQEARIGAAIRSRHVVEVIAAGVDRALGAPWLAMELLEGQTLTARVQERGPLPPGELRALFAQLGDAIGAAHDAGIVHRDLKPENLFLQTVSGESAPWSLKVLDFGVSKVIHESRTSATSTGQIGTPLWMAPEQCDSRGAIRPSTDVWALGLLAFWALTAEPYWLAARGAEPNLSAVLSELLLNDLEPPSRRSARWPAALDPWFARCVHRDAAARFAHGRAACDALLAQLHALERPPVLAAPWAAPAPAIPLAPAAPAPSTSSARPASATDARWPWAVVALCFVVGGTTAALGALRRSQQPEPEAPSNSDPQNQVPAPTLGSTNDLRAGPRPMRAREPHGALDSECGAATGGQLATAERVSGAPASAELDAQDAHVAGCKSVLEVCGTGECPSYRSMLESGFTYWCCPSSR